MTLEDHLLTEARNPASEGIDTLDATGIVRLMNVNAFGLAAGMKPCAGICPCHIVFLARNMNPRKSNDWFGKSPRRFASLQ